MRKTLFFLISQFLLLIPLGARAQDEAVTRAPFVLEFPELNNIRMTQLSKALPMTNVRTLKFRVLAPFSDRISQNKIFTRINGEASTMLHRMTIDREGLVITCDLDSRAGAFKLKPGKNAVEIFAADREGKNYYASYVLLLGAGNLAQLELSNATLEKSVVTAGDDKNAPEIILSPATALLQKTSVKLQGIVADLASDVVSVKINGQPAVLTPTKGKRDLVLSPDSSAPVEARFVYDFNQTLDLSRQNAVVIEARDKAGNVSTLTMPVREPEIATASSFTGRKYALVVGVSNYKFAGDGLKNLQFADADAKAVRDFLLSAEGGKFSAENVRFLLNEQATLAAVQEAFSFLKKATVEDLVMIYFAGHGAPDPFDPKNLYFLLHNTKLSDVPQTALGMTELQQFLDTELRSKRTVVFVDTCHSAGLSGEKLATTAARNVGENNLINLYAARLFREEGRAVLTSADVNETSFESSRWGGGHGVFTWTLLEGLRGKADLNVDNFITAGEIFNYVTDGVARETGFRQNPRPLLGSNRNLTLAAVRGK